MRTSSRVTIKTGIQGLGHKLEEILWKDLSSLHNKTPMISSGDVSHAVDQGRLGHVGG